MRVALAHPTYWPEVRRGAERLTRELAVGLAGRDHDVRVVTSHAGATSRSVEDGVEVVRLRRPPFAARLERRMLEPWVATLPRLWLELRGGNDDIVQALQPGDAVASIRAGRPTVFSYMGIPHRQAIVNRRARLTLTVQAVSGARAVTALSEHARDAFARWLGVEARVLWPPVDTERFTPGGTRSEAPSIVCAADAREPRKRVELLVAALPIVRRSVPGARLWLDARTAQAFAGTDGVELVRMDEGLVDVFRGAWVSALPSWGEAFGLVLAEALACGTPVVGAAREGIPEVLGGDDSIGRLFEGDAPADVARALVEALELARDPATPARARARAERFSAARCVDAHEALYREILGG